VQGRASTTLRRTSDTVHYTPSHPRHSAANAEPTDHENVSGSISPAHVGSPRPPPTFLAICRHIHDHVPQRPQYRDEIDNARAGRTLRGPPAWLFVGVDARADGAHWDYCTHYCKLRAPPACLAAERQTATRSGRKRRVRRHAGCGAGRVICSCEPNARLISVSVICEVMGQGGGKLTMTRRSIDRGVETGAAGRAERGTAAE
jgi:hypothetical protein